MNRGLTAISAADVAGFGVLVGIDEEGTVRAHKGHGSVLEGFESGIPAYVIM
jgi:hypothetical protein